MLTASVFLLALLFFFSVWIGLWGKIPDKKELGSIENFISSEVYASDGELLGKYFIYDRSHAHIDQISENVINSLIATEDARFYSHSGIDYRSLGRVLFKTLLMGETQAGGGSTLSQQLAKNLYPRSNNNGLFSLPVSKIREFIIAHRLERIYTKEDILLLYLNTVPFGENVFGISAASLRFFNKNPRDLYMEEAALLVGTLQATSFFNPRQFPERAISRRNTVISQLHRYQYISAEEADSLKNIPLQLNYNPMTHNQGPAPYFRERIRQDVLAILKDYNTIHGTDYNLYTDGLRIYTTLDYHLQLLAEQSIASQLSRQQKLMDAYYRRMPAQRSASLVKNIMHNSQRYKNLQKQKLTQEEIEESFNTPVSLDFFSWDGPGILDISPLDSIYKAQQILHSGLISLDAENGHVKAWVGGNDFRYFQFDHILSNRQVGSTFKPFVYATALQAGIDPCEFVSNERIIYEEYNDWSPANASGEYEGYYSMKGALAQSVNTVTAHYIHQTGAQAVIDNARRAGITAPLPRVPSIALGTAEINLMEMTAAYAGFLGKGRNLQPVWLLKIEDSNGNIIFQQEASPPAQRVWDESTSLLTREMLTEAINNGTAQSLRTRFGLQGNMAGKTGTTQNNADTWFIGFTPGLITGVWTGLENPAFAALYGSPLGSGASAVPLWGEYMREVAGNSHTRKYTQGNFSPLPDSLALMMDCAMFLEELPGENLWERIFGSPDEERVRRRDRRDRERPSRLRRFLDNLF